MSFTRITPMALTAPVQHYDVILIMTSFATELATPSVTDERTDTLPHISYIKIFSFWGPIPLSLYRWG